MLLEINPKIPMRNKEITLHFYLNKLGFELWGNNPFDHYLMLKKDNIQIHFFLHPDLNPLENYGQIYIRTNQIDELYQSFLKKDVEIHPNGHLETKPWRQREFSILDPDHNLLTFGQIIL